MAQEGFEKWYLFIDASKCCGDYFPLSSNCPYERTPQTGYYWEKYSQAHANDAVLPIYNHTYYPDLQGEQNLNGFVMDCVNF